MKPGAMQCFVLAGWLGTRMRPLTEKIPKVLLPVNGVPFAFHQLELLKRNGFTRVTYSVGFLGEQVREALGDGKKWGLTVDYVDEGAELRGTGGALRLAFDEAALDEVFCVLYGDSYLPIDYREPWKFFATRTEPALMTVFHNQGRFDRSNARLDGDLVYYDKKAAAAGQGFEYIDYGLSILRREVVEKRLPSGRKGDLAELLHSLSVEKKLVGFEVRERFYEVGSPEGLTELERYLAGKSISKPGS